MTKKTDPLQEAAENLVALKDGNGYSVSEWEAAFDALRDALPETEATE